MKFDVFFFVGNLSIRRREKWLIILIFSLVLTPRMTRTGLSRKMGQRKVLLIAAL
jgi:hypothetical protein